LAADWEVGVTLFHSLGIVAYSGVSAGAPGMVLMNPTSIAYSGTSATLGANGQVTFSAVTSLSLNGVFTADFDNYVISISSTVATGDVGLRMRLRLSGTDATTNYVRQYLSVDGSSINAGRETSQSEAGLGAVRTSFTNGQTVMIYGSSLAQATAFRSIDVDGISSAYIQEWAGTHSTATAYDGVTLFPTSSNITGALQVYGVRS
jgi:hypothetical protein